MYTERVRGYDGDGNGGEGAGGGVVAMNGGVSIWVVHVGQGLCLLPIVEK